MVGRRKKSQHCSGDGEPERQHCTKIEEELDELSLQLKAERQKALQILDSLDIGRACCVEDASKEVVSEHAGDKSKTGRAKKRVKKDVETNEDTAVVQERTKTRDEEAFTLNTDLRELFSSSMEDKGGRGFSFLASNDAIPEFPSEGQVSASGSIAATGSSPIPELPSEDQVSVSGSTAATVAGSKDVKYFFFHSDCEELQNRVDENSFYRTETWEELESKWPAKRTAMKQSFRRRHRDAIRAERKKKRTGP